MEKSIPDQCIAHLGLEEKIGGVKARTNLVVGLLGVLIFITCNIWSGISDSNERIAEQKAELMVKLEHVQGTVDVHAMKIGALEKKIAELHD